AGSALRRRGEGVRGASLASDARRDPRALQARARRNEVTANHRDSSGAPKRLDGKDPTQGAPRARKVKRERTAAAAEKKKKKKKKKKKNSPRRTQRTQRRCDGGESEGRFRARSRPRPSLTLTPCPSPSPSPSLSLILSLFLSPFLS